MLAAEQDQAGQELPKSIFQPRHVRRNAGSLQHVERGRERAARPTDWGELAAGVETNGGGEGSGLTRQ